MGRYIIRRSLAAIPTMLVLIAVSFFMMRLAPGGPFDANRKATAEVIANLNRTYHLDEPLLAQFLRYLWGVLHFDFGPSFKYRDYSVAELIWQGFPVSLELGLWATFLSFVVGVFLGTLAALKQNTAIDYSVMAVGMSGIAIPAFVMAPLFQLLFGVMWLMLPVGGWDGTWRTKLLPIVALAIPNVAYIARLTRGSMIEAIRSNHVRTARAKGIGERRTITRHAMLGGLLPVFAYLGPATAGIITGSVVVEKIFGIPGIGRYFVEAASNRDYTLVLGVVIFYGALIILFNLLVDLMYSVLDPRIRYD